MNAKFHVSCEKKRSILHVLEDEAGTGSVVKVAEEAEDVRVAPRQPALDFDLAAECEYGDEAAARWSGGERKRGEVGRGDSNR